jgi:hypothetical protein
MKQRSWLRRIRTALLMAPLLSAIAQGEVRVEFPDDDPGPPFYARIRHNFAIQNGQWAAIIFYRSPNCVAPSFNLLRLFNPAAFGCPLTVEGFALYDQVPPPPGVSPKGAHAKRTDSHATSRAQLHRGKRLFALVLSEKEVVRSVWDERLLADISGVDAALSGGRSAVGVQPLDEAGFAQQCAARWPVQVTNCFEQEAGNRAGIRATGLARARGDRFPTEDRCPHPAAVE